MTLDLERYKAVIQMVFADNTGNTPDVFFAELHRSLRIAAAMAGDTAPAQRVALSNGADRHSDNKPGDVRDVLKKAAQNPREVQVLEEFRGSGAILISSAPPVAGADELEDADDSDVDQWESRPGKGDGCERLSKKLREVLPRSIEVQIKGFDEPLKLVCGIGSPGIAVVHVSYTIPGSTVGPRYTILTTQKEINPTAIIEDITTQAGAIYSKEKRTLTPRPLAPVALPTAQELDAHLQRERQARSGYADPNDGLRGPEAGEAREDAAAWSANRSPTWQ